MAGFYLQLITLVAMSFCIESILSTGQLQSCALTQTGMDDHLRLAGLSGPVAKTYSNKLRKHNIDVNILPGLTLDQLKNAGIAAMGDRLKIQKYFSNDGDSCANGNLCKNGGRCQDGFQCYKCLCTVDFYGPTCKSACPCKNSGKCIGSNGKLECKCIPGFTGTLCAKQWLSENIFNQLERKVKTLTQKVEQSRKEIADQKKALAASKLNNNGWRMVRVDENLDQLAKIALHQTTPTYIQKMPSIFPKNTKAIIISVFINFWNNNGHAYLNFKAYQQGNENNGSAIVENTHYNVYANTFYYEIMLPWDTALPNNLFFVVTSSYLTGGSNNWHKIKLVGYVEA